MKTRFIALLGTMLLVGALASGCGPTGKATTTATPRPFYNDSWWGTDPVCSPGCPLGASPSW